MLDNKLVEKLYKENSKIPFMLSKDIFSYALNMGYNLRDSENPVKEKESKNQEVQEQKPRNLSEEKLRTKIRNELKRDYILNEKKVELKTLIECIKMFKMAWDSDNEYALSSTINKLSNKIELLTLEVEQGK